LKLSEILNVFLSNLRVVREWNLFSKISFMIFVVFILQLKDLNFKLCNTCEIDY
jgi:hypothetical protein